MLSIFFMRLLAICLSSLEKCLSRSFAHSKLGYLPFYYSVCMSSLYILDIGPLSDTWCIKIFSHPMGCLYFLNDVLWNTKVFIVMMSKITSFFFCCLYFLMSYLSNHCLIQGQEDLSMFSSKNSYSSALTMVSDSFWVNFVWHTLFYCTPLYCTSQLSSSQKKDYVSFYCATPCSFIVVVWN